MSSLFPTWAQPLNIFSLHGTMCCQNMRSSYRSKILVHNFLCYDASSIHDANLIILWGSFSKKLLTLIESELQAISCDRAILHIRGCDARVDNTISESSLATVLPVSLVFSNCVLNHDDIKQLLREARSCLKV